MVWEPLLGNAHLQKQGNSYYMWWSVSCPAEVGMGKDDVWSHGNKLASCSDPSPCPVSAEMRTLPLEGLMREVQGAVGMIFLLLRFSGMPTFHTFGQFVLNPTIFLGFQPLLCFGHNTYVHSTVSWSAQCWCPWKEVTGSGAYSCPLPLVDSTGCRT